MYFVILFNYYFVFEIRNVSMICLLEFLDIFYRILDVKRSGEYLRGEGRYI